MHFIFVIIDNNMFPGFTIILRLMLLKALMALSPRAERCGFCGEERSLKLREKCEQKRPVLLF